METKIFFKLSQQVVLIIKRKIEEKERNSPPKTSGSERFQMADFLIKFSPIVKKTHKNATTNQKQFLPSLG